MWTRKCYAWRKWRKKRFTRSSLVLDTRGEEETRSSPILHRSHLRFRHFRRFSAQIWMQIMRWRLADECCVFIYLDRFRAYQCGLSDGSSSWSWLWLREEHHNQCICCSASYMYRPYRGVRVRRWNWSTNKTENQKRNCRDYAVEGKRVEMSSRRFESSLRVAVVCSSNMNRSMEAHSVLQKKVSGLFKYGSSRHQFYSMSIHVT